MGGDLWLVVGWAFLLHIQYDIRAKAVGGQFLRGRGVVTRSSSLCLLWHTGWCCGRSISRVVWRATLSSLCLLWHTSRGRGELIFDGSRRAMRVVMSVARVVDRREAKRES